MQDHDFEKQVQQKMAEMKLLPSESVWRQVELRLRKDKRRRWILWLPFLVAGLSLGGYWVWNASYTSREKNLPVIATSQKPKQPGEVNKPALAKDHFKPNALNKKISPSFKGNSQAKVERNNFSTGLPDKLNHPQKDIDSGTPAASAAIHITHSTSEYSEEMKKPGSETPQALGDPEDMTQGDLMKEISPVEVKGFSLTANFINTSLLQVRSDANTKLTSGLHTKKRGWQWGLSFEAGRSSLTKGSLNKLFGGGQMDYTNTPAVSQPAVTYKNPNPLKAGTAISTGIFVKKQVSPTFALSLGVNYTLFTSTHKVGRRIDSSMTLQAAFASNRISVGQYYRLDNTDSYADKYHFIEIPVLLQTRLVRSRKTPLFWDLGFSLSKLIASNALSFDNVAGVYYKDDNQLHKTQVKLITGVPVRLFAKRQYSLQVGPEFQYGISQVFSQETTAGNHFLFLGLKASVVLGK